MRPRAPRVTRSPRTVAAEQFVEAAVALGGAPGHILRRHVLPHL